MVAKEKLPQYKLITELTLIISYHDFNEKAMIISLLPDTDNFQCLKQQTTFKSIVVKFSNFSFSIEFGNIWFTYIYRDSQ